ncbi:MAG TPA: FAD-dependent oxidoreductase [Acidimicrobiales bacterium]|nr:FAD-dependent oxidoreductase [Acidimicrobiales bacterium]
MTGAPIVIIGGGLAGAKAAESLRGWGYEERITLVTGEPLRPYERPALSKSYLRGRSGFDDTAVHAERWYAGHGVELLTSTRAVALDPAARRVRLEPGGTITYDQLLLATGAHPRRLTVPGSGLEGVYHLRTVADADAIRAAAMPGRRAIVVGAGWIGTEVAASLRRLGLEIALVFRSGVPFARSLGADIGAVFADLHAEHGVALHPGVTVTAVRGRSAVEGVELSNGTILDADLVVAGLGVEPAVELAQAAGLKVAGGVLTDAGLATSAPGVYAAGDVASVEHPVFGTRVRSEHWWSALTQPPVAAANMLGHPAAYDWIPTFTSKQYDVMVEYTGHAPGCDTVVFRGAPESRHFAAFWIDGGRVAAGMTVGIPGLERHIRALVSRGTPVSLAALADEDASLADLAATATRAKEQLMAHEHQHPEITEGLRQWYDACPCCMSQALPEVKQALDEERATASTHSAH